ncbi:CBS domain-containing protein [bacterium]|nr:CBS domain-containing protein [bacterium]
MLQVRDVMSRDVLTVNTDMDIHTLARTLTAAHISGAPVLDGKGELVGVVSLHDLVHHEGQVGDTETAAYWHGEPRLPGGYNLVDLSKSETTVEQIMTPAVYSLDEDAGLVELCDFFLKGEIHRVLVTHKGKLVGIVTPTDMIRCLRHQLTLPIPAS